MGKKRINEEEWRKMWKMRVLFIYFIYLFIWFLPRPSRPCLLRAAYKIKQNSIKIYKIIKLHLLWKQNLSTWFPALKSFLSLNIGPKQDDRVQMTHKDMLPSTSFIRWTLVLFFLATTILVGFYACLLYTSPSPRD